MRTASLSKLMVYSFASLFLTAASVDPLSAQTSRDQQRVTTKKNDSKDKGTAPATSQPKCTYDVKKHKACPTGRALKRKCTGDKNWVFVNCR